MSGWITGGWGSVLLVSPRFHRLHHAPLRPVRMGQNYAVLLPVWDWAFGTGDFRRGSSPTGTPEEPESLASGGWLRQQAVGLRRMVGAIAGR